jgi:hypothetical protein
MLMAVDGISASIARAEIIVRAPVTSAACPARIAENQDFGRPQFHY